MTRLNTPEHEAREEEVRQTLGQVWRCELHKYEGHYNPIEWYATKGDRVSALVELKVRFILRERYPTVYLSLRKFVALHLGAMGVLGHCPLLFAAAWEDAIGWVTLDKVPPLPLLMRGRYDRGLPNDIEPVLEVPIALFEIRHRDGRKVAP